MPADQTPAPEARPPAPTEGPEAIIRWLLDAVAKVQAGARPPMLMTAADLATEGFGEIRTIRRFDSAGMLPAPIRLGGRVCWSRDELVAWVAAGAPARAEWERLKAAAKGGRR